MSSIDLVILGEIMGHPVSAYELVNRLEKTNLRRWIKISSQGVYRNITILHKKGYLKGNKVKEGNMPEKAIFSITQKGTDYFNKLMLEISNKMENFYFSFNSVIANIDKVDKDTSLKLLESIRLKIYESKGELNASYEFFKNKIPFRGLVILELYHKIFNIVLTDWIDDVIIKYREM